ISDNQGRDHFSRAELAMDRRGHFLGLRVSVVANLGAYLSPLGAFIPTRSTDLVAGLYKTAAIAVNVKGVCTNTVPVCAYRGAGFPETASIEFRDHRIELVMGNVEYGTGLITSYKQLVADRLGVHPDKIDVIMGDTDRTPRGLTGGSRALPVAGTALHEASKQIVEKGRQI